MYAFCQNTTLEPTIKDGYYCYDSLQIREVARLTKVTKAQSEVITHQDSVIKDFKQYSFTSDSIICIKDSIITNQTTILANKDKEIIKNSSICQLDKDILKAKHKKTVKKIGFIAILEGVFIFLLIISKK